MSEGTSPTQAVRIMTQIQPNSPVIRVEAASKVYFVGVRRRRISALQDVSFEVLQGEVFAFLGLNGAGKTTTIKLLLDHARPTSGRVFLFDQSSRTPSARFRVGYMPDLPHFYRFLTARELLDYFGKLFELPAALSRKRSSELLEKVGLTGREDEPLKGFSRGMLQRVGLAQALLNDPDLLILDEPLGGLDPIGRHDFHDIIMEQKQAGKTIFFSSHILEDAEKIATRVGIIHKGKLVACGALESLVGSGGEWEAEILASDMSELHSLISNRGWKSTSFDRRMIVTLPNDQAMREITRLAGDGRVNLISLQPRRLSLEEVFLAELKRWEA